MKRRDLLKSIGKVVAGCAVAPSVVKAKISSKSEYDGLALNDEEITNICLKTVAFLKTVTFQRNTLNELMSG